jgi:hypothetical protein
MSACKRCEGDGRAVVGIEDVILCPECAGHGDDRYGIKGPVEITRERWWEMLECLPPCRWIRRAGVELFFVSERLSGDIVAHFVQIGERFFEIQDVSTKPPAELVAACRALIEKEAAPA